MSGKYRLQKTAKRLNFQKEDVRTRVPANLGLAIGGQKLVEVPTRASYHYARIRGNLSEVVQVFNISTSPVYDLPVLISYRNNRWEVEGLDTGRYTSWSSTAFLPKHGAQHSFDPDAPGGDPVWVWGRQMMPLGAIPSGSNGGPNVIIEPSTYWQDNSWHYAGGTGTADIIPSYKPTGSSARMVLVYLDSYGNPQLLGGSTYFSASLTGTSQVVPYIPAMPDTDSIGIAGIRLVSGTSAISWNNIYDLRPWIVGSGYIPTGTSGVTDHGALTGLLDNDHPQYMLTGSAGTSALTKNEIAFGSDTNTITSSSYFHVTGAAGYANSYKSVYINFFGGTGSNSNYYSLNIGTDDGVNDLSNLALWSYGGESIFDMYYARGTQDAPTTPLKDDTLSRLGFAAFSPSLGADYWYTAQMKLVAAENFGGTNFGSYWQFINVGTGGAGNQNSLYLYPKKATFGGSVQIPSGSSTHPYPSYYLGSDIIDGSWRTTRDGDNLAFQRRESGVWVTKGYPNTGTASTSSSSTPTYPAIFDDNTFKTTGTALHFNDGLNVIVTGTSVWIDWTGTAGTQGEPGTPGSNTLLIYDNDIFKVTGTTLVFRDGLVVSSSGSIAYVDWTGTAGSQGEQGIPGSNTLLLYDDNTFKVTGSAIHFNDGLNVIVTGSSAWVDWTGVATITDHGNLTGLTDNDHLQYRLTGTAISHLELSDLNSANYTHLTATNHTDLTDGGATTLHKHDHGGLDGLTDNDHPQYLLTGTQVDHGGLTGLLDNDHPQYLLTGTAISSTDEKIKISSNDTTSSYLNGKLIEGAGISLTEVGDGGNETLRISYTGSAGTQGETGPMGSSSRDLYWSIDGALFTGSSVAPPIIATRDFNIDSVLIYVENPGTTGTTTIDINKNGSSIFSTRPNVSFNDADQKDEQIPSVISVSKGDIFTLDLDETAQNALTLSVAIIASVTNGVVVYDDSSFKVTGTAISFDSNLSVAVTGSVAFISSSASGGNNTYTDTFANRPSGTVNNGDLFFPSNGFFIDRVTGSNSNYQSWGPLFPFTAPDTIGFEWINQNSCTLSSTNGGLVMYDPAHNAVDYGLYIKTAPATPYTFEIAFRSLLMSDNQSFGLVHRQSSDGKFILYHYVSATGAKIIVNSMSSPTGVVADLSVLAITARDLIWMRIYDNGTNRYFSISIDGINFIQTFTHANTTYCTADQIGFAIASRNATYPIYSTILHWKVT